MAGKTLLLLRHGKSDWDDRALADHDRPLAKRGRRAARMIARHLREKRIRPKLVLCSSALRARATCELLVPSLPAHTEFRVEEDLYAASREDLLRRLARIPATASSVMLIGHNPGLQELAEFLAADPDDRQRLAEDFPTCALAAFTVPAWKTLGEGDGALTELVLPRRLSPSG